MNNKYNDHALLLELLPYPAFIAQDGKITHCNNYARQMVITPGDEIAPMLGENLEQFNTLQDGSINMDLTVDVFTCPAVITKLSEGHLFTMPGNVTPELKGMCQLSTHLRLHISRLFSFVQQHGDAVDDDVHRELHRINRIFNNVFNARAFAEKDNCYLQERDLRSIVGAVLDECVALLDEADIELKHDLFPDPIYTVCDVQMIKQALYT